MSVRNALTQAIADARYLKLDASNDPVTGDLQVDADFFFGTLLNRFCSQALVGYPLSIYGEGGQTRGYISLKDTCDSILNVLEEPGEDYEIMNGYTENWSVLNIALNVQRATKCEIQHVPNPRKEAEYHQYNPFNTKFMNRVNGFRVMMNVMCDMVEELKKYKERINKDKFVVNK